MVRNLVISERKNNPCATLQAIGDKFGVSRERVRQILSESGLPTVSFRRKYLCNHCGKVFKGRRNFCNRECQHAYYQVELICDYCGKPFQRAQCQIKASLRPIMMRGPDKLFFCGNVCKGKWIAKHYGFRVHPENCSIKN